MPARERAQGNAPAGEFEDGQQPEPIGSTPQQRRDQVAAGGDAAQDGSEHDGEDVGGHRQEEDEHAEPDQLQRQRSEPGQPKDEQHQAVRPVAGGIGWHAADIGPFLGVGAASGVGPRAFEGKRGHGCGDADKPVEPRRQPQRGAYPYAADQVKAGEERADNRASRVGRIQ